MFALKHILWVLVRTALLMFNAKIIKYHNFPSDVKIVVFTAMKYFSIITYVYTRRATQDDFSGRYFRIFEIIIFCCVVAICDLVHEVETIFHLSYVLTASGNLF